MRATVKVAYFDNSGLHKPGEVVEVKELKPYHLPIKEEVEEVEEIEAPVTETAEEMPTKKKKKSTKKKG